MSQALPHIHQRYNMVMVLLLLSAQHHAKRHSATIQFYFVLDWSATIAVARTIFVAGRAITTRNGVVCELGSHCAARWQITLFFVGGVQWYGCGRCSGMHVMSVLNLYHWRQNESIRVENTPCCTQASGIRRAGVADHDLTATIETAARVVNRRLLDTIFGEFQSCFMTLSHYAVFCCRCVSFEATLLVTATLLTAGTRWFRHVASDTACRRTRSSSQVCSQQKKLVLFFFFFFFEFIYRCEEIFYSMLKNKRWRYMRILLFVTVRWHAIVWCRRSTRQCVTASVVKCTAGAPMRRRSANKTIPTQRNASMCVCCHSIHFRTVEPKYAAWFDFYAAQTHCGCFVLCVCVFARLADGM